MVAHLPVERARGLLQKSPLPGTRFQQRERWMTLDLLQGRLLQLLRANMHLAPAQLHQPARTVLDLQQWERPEQLVQWRCSLKARCLQRERLMMKHLQSKRLRRLLWERWLSSAAEALRQEHLLMKHLNSCQPLETSGRTEQWRLLQIETAAQPPQLQMRNQFWMDKVLQLLLKSAGKPVLPQLRHSQHVGSCLLIPSRAQNQLMMRCPVQLHLARGLSTLLKPLTAEILSMLNCCQWEGSPDRCQALPTAPSPP
mmetsp:Transcript_104967/g.192414  ORF Transcript_104967/g.192414 Transcript_104967/m.192414 type:complete len:255 (-) Transcript_104967:120-884(-)